MIAGADVDSKLHRHVRAHLHAVADQHSRRDTDARAAAPSTRAPSPTATVDRHLIIITEADIAQAVRAAPARSRV